MRFLPHLLGHRSSSQDERIADVGDNNFKISGNPWILPKFPMELPNDDVHIWRLNLEQPDLYYLKFASVLSKKERIRAASFRFNRNRKQFIVGRSVLRIILSFYLDIKPTHLEFKYGLFGKPYIDDRCFKGRIQFNLTHSHELAIYVVANRRRVGVDLEHIKNILDFKRIVTRILSKQEDSIFKKQPKSQQLRTFFDCWTIREAYSKAIGTGLTKVSNQLNFSAILKELACILNTRGHVKRVSNWSICSFTPAPNYTAALVVEGHNCHLHNFQFIPEKHFNQVTA